MSNRNVFNYAMLAEASYADFSKESFSDKYVIDSIKGTNEGESPKPESFAKLVADNYQVVAHHKDRIKESSFSGTLFRGKAGTDNAGEYVLALRGTQEFEKDLWQASITNIVKSDMANHQAIDMYN